MKIHMPRDAEESRRVRAEAQQLANEGQNITLVHPRGVLYSQPIYEDLKPEDPKMTDFRVGDVVRLVGSSTQGTIIERRTNLATDGWLVAIDGFGLYFYTPNNLALVSRAPSEDMRDALQYLARSDSNLDQKIAKSRGLKVGDRVRVRNTERKGTVDTVKPWNSVPAVWLRMDDDSMPGTVMYFTDSLELLPPEPAKRSPREPCACDPIGEGIRMCICPEPVKQETFSEEVSVRVEDWSGTEVMRVDQKPMTATELNMARERALGQEYKFQVQPPPSKREQEIIVRYEKQDIKLDELGDGIAAKIPVRQRSLRSQTLTWAPCADWDNLPDAD